MSTPKFTRLIRFANSAGRIYYGEADGKDLTPEGLVGQTVPIYQGESPWDSDFIQSLQTEQIAKILSPLASIPMGYGVGVNYGAHSEEAKIQSVTYPMVFTKTPNTLAGPFEDVPFSSELRELDYEGEMVVIIGKDCKDLGENEDPTPYILGYSVGNDVSSRYWQRPERSGGQHGYAKSFDKFAPIGPIIASTAAINEPAALRLKTRVNGEERQSARTSEMIHHIPAILRFISRGTTLKPGTIIMTGTPGGVAAFMKPPRWLGDGDVVEVEISGIGTIRNKMVLTN